VAGFIGVGVSFFDSMVVFLRQLSNAMGVIKIAITSYCDVIAIFFIPLLSQWVWYARFYPAMLT
jgi:hypothetical protein